jgi:phosphoribosylformylglycinamidine (FGAM) synthase-like amidotransferase family enzyme
MRLGLHGLVGRDTDVEAWPSVVVALGGRAQVVAFDGSGRCDAIVVCGEGEPAATQAVMAFARGGGAVLGVGTGFRTLCALGLLPGRVTALDAEEGEAADAHVRVEGRATPFTSAIPAGRVMRFKRAPAAALRYDVGEPDALEARRQVIFRYCDAGGGTESERAQMNDPSRARAIAGVCSDEGNVVGVLAAAEAIQAIGAQLLGSLRMHLRKR